MPGILAGGRSSSQGLSDSWRQHGDVLFVEYEGKRFRAEQVIDKVVGFLDTRRGANYQHIVFIGSSMGGLLAYDVVQRLDAETRAKAALVAIDAPTSARDFQSPLDKTSQLMRVLPFGPIWNLLSRPVMGLMTVPPKEENIEPGVNRAELARRVEEMRGYPLSFWRDQVMYIITHGKLANGSLRDIRRLVYVRSRRDIDTVRQQAYNVWSRASGDAVYIEADTTHVGFAERPRAWRAAFVKVFRSLE